MEKQTLSFEFWLEKSDLLDRIPRIAMIQDLLKFKYIEFSVIQKSTTF